MTVLDAGCGTGWMCRWLHEQTGAHMVGMDTASAALEIGGNQAAAKGAENIRFVWGDILSPPFPPATFDAAICIDSLHAQFFKQLELPVKSLAGVIKTAGTMAIFFNALISDDSEKQRLEGDKTHLAEALSTLGLPYEYKDLSESDKGFWLACRAAMQELRELFIADGIEDIYIAWPEYRINSNPVYSCGVFDDAVLRAAGKIRFIPVKIIGETVNRLMMTIFWFALNCPF